MESNTYIKFVKISPKKLRFILHDIKKRSPKQAADVLFTSQNRNAKILYKALRSAISNAKTSFNVDENVLQFKQLVIEEGPSLKRMRPGPKGMANMYKRRMSHIKITLTAPEQLNLSPQKKLSVKKTENKTETKLIKPVVEPKKIEAKHTKTTEPLQVSKKVRKSKLKTETVS